MKKDRNVYRRSNIIACHCMFRQLSDKKNHGFRAKNNTMWYIVRWKEIFSNFMPFYRSCFKAGGAELSTEWEYFDAVF